MTYGGSPNEWWSMTPFRLAGFLVNRVKAEAYQSLRRVGELMTADPMYEQRDRQAQMDQWRKVAGLATTPKPIAQQVDALRKLGFDVEVVH